MSGRMIDERHDVYKSILSSMAEIFINMKICDGSMRLMGNRRYRQRTITSRGFTFKEESAYKLAFAKLWTAAAIIAEVPLRDTGIYEMPYINETAYDSIINNGAWLASLSDELDDDFFLVALLEVCYTLAMMESETEKDLFDIIIMNLTNEAIQFLYDASPYDEVTTYQKICEMWEYSYPLPKNLPGNNTHK